MKKTLLALIAFSSAAFAAESVTEMSVFPRCDSVMLSEMARVEAPLSENVSLELDFGPAFEIVEGSLEDIHVLVEPAVKLSMPKGMYIKAGLRQTCFLSDMMGLGLTHFHPAFGFQASDRVSFETGVLISPLSKDLIGFPMSVKVKF